MSASRDGRASGWNRDQAERPGTTEFFFITERVQESHLLFPHAASIQTELTPPAFCISTMELATGDFAFRIDPCLRVVGFWVIAVAESDDSHEGSFWLRRLGDGGVKVAVGTTNGKDEPAHRERRNAPGNAVD